MRIPDHLLPPLSELMADGGKLLVVLCLKEMPYEEYLQTAHWRDVRWRALLRSGFKCETCLKKTRLDVHHITYANKGEEKDEDLIVMCGGPDGCHSRWHETMKHRLHAEFERFMNEN